MATDTIKQRINSVDLLRGVVMMLMLLDHTRDFVHNQAFSVDPTDPATTNAALFFTRWVTHFCAPVFVFLAGTSIYLQRMNGKPTGALARFLWTRGLWLVVLEFTVVRFAIVFNLDYTFIGMAQVIWVIGVSMILMAAFIYLPLKVVGGVGVALIVLHNLLDPLLVPPNVAFMNTPPPDFAQSLWIILHQMGVVPIFGGAYIFFAYPLVPWIGVMMAGYAFGIIYEWQPERRRRFLLLLGAAATVLFLVLRFTNLYGDPVPWSAEHNPVLSFLNTNKYPPSLLFLLMTLGPALVVLALADRMRGDTVPEKVAITFGRVPLFFYVLQWFTAHTFGIVLSLLAGKDIGYFFVGLAEVQQAAPPGYGFPLWVVYAAWLGGLIILYPLCAWYADYKRRNRHWLLSYL